MIEQQSQVMQMFRCEYTCSISNKVMRKPVIDQQGFSYQQQDIKQYFTNNLNCVSPLTGKEFTSKKLIQNIYLQNLIEKVQTEIPKMYTYIKILKNQILHLKLENQMLNQEKSLNLSQMQNQNQNQNNIIDSNINNNNSISNGTSTLNYSNGNTSKKPIQQHKNDQLKQYQSPQSSQKPQYRLSKRKLIKKYKFQKYYDHSMGQLLNSQKILSQELKNKQKITNQRKIKKYQKLNITNSKTIQNLIERLNLQQKTIKNIKNNNNTQKQTQIQNHINKNNNNHQQKQQKQTTKNYYDMEIQKHASYETNKTIEVIRQEQQVNTKIINDLQNENVLLKDLIQKLRANLQQFLKQNTLLKNNASNSYQYTKQHEQFANRILTLQQQISNKTWQMIKLQQQVKQNIRLHKIDLIQQQQKTNSLQRKLNQVQSRNKYIKTLQTQLKQKINQISNVNIQNQKIRKADIKQIQLLQQKNQQLINNIKFNTEIWVMFLIITQDSFTNFKQNHKKSIIKPNQIKSDQNTQIFPIFKKNKKLVEVIQIIDESEDQKQQNQVSDSQNKQDLKIQQMQVQIPLQNILVVNKSLANIQQKDSNAQISYKMVDQMQKWSEKSFDEWISYKVDILSKVITQKIKGFNSQQSTKIKQLNKVFRKLSFLKKVESDGLKEIFPNFYVVEKSQKKKKQKSLSIGYEFELINLLRILSKNQFTDLVWDETISIKSVSSQICDKQWEVLMKYSVLYPNIVEINLSNSRIVNMRKQDIEKLKNLKVMNLGNAPLNLASRKELIQYKKYNPQVEFIF